MLHVTETPESGAKKWQNVASMLVGRNCFGAVYFNGCIIVAGGSKKNCLSPDEWTFTNEVEMFVPPKLNDKLSIGQWSLLSSMQYPMLVDSAVAFENEIFMFGR